jgi:hypothetical protein
MNQSFQHVNFVMYAVTFVVLLLTLLIDKVPSIITINKHNCMIRLMNRFVAVVFAAILHAYCNLTNY